MTHDEMMTKVYKEISSVPYKEGTKAYNYFIRTRMRRNNEAKILCAKIKRLVDEGETILAKRAAKKWLNLLVPNDRYNELCQCKWSSLTIIEKLKRRIEEIQEEIKSTEKFIEVVEQDMRRLAKFNNEALGIDDKEPLAIWAETWAAEAASAKGLTIEYTNDPDAFTTDDDLTVVTDELFEEPTDPVVDTKEANEENTKTKTGLSARKFSDRRLWTMDPTKETGLN